MYLMVDPLRFEILMQARREIFYDGRSIIPGGSIEENETLKEACCRELFEETGVEADENELIGLGEVIVHDAGNVLRFHPFMFFADRYGVSATHDDHGNEFVWTPLHLVIAGSFRNSATTFMQISEELNFHLHKRAQLEKPRKS